MTFIENMVPIEEAEEVEGALGRKEFYVKSITVVAFYMFPEPKKFMGGYQSV